MVSGPVLMGALRQLEETHRHQPTRRFCCDLNCEAFGNSHLQQETMAQRFLEPHCGPEPTARHLKDLGLKGDPWCDATGEEDLGGSLRPLAPL